MMLSPIDISKHPVRIWDWPTRLFHWLLVLASVGCVPRTFFV